MKKIVANLKLMSLLIGFISLSGFYVYGQDPYTLTDDDVVVENGMIQSCSYDFTVKDIIIPETLDGQTVIGIAYNDLGVFYNKGITKVQLPATLTTIGDYAFKNNQLTSLTIPNSVTTIEAEVFAYNQLTSVIFEQNSNIRLINEFAFDPNPGLTGITLPSNNNPGFTGYKDTNKNDYLAGDTFTNFGVACYADLPAHTLTLNDVIFENGKIEDYFGGYTVIIIPASFNVDGNKKNVTTIGPWAFSRNQLTSVTIGNTVTTIEERAFYMNQLTRAYIGNGVTTIREGAFSGNQLTSVIIPNSVTAIGEFAFYMNQLVRLTISNNVTIIGNEAFSNNHLTIVVIPNSVTTIGSWAFSENHLTSIIIPNSVITIGIGAFSSNQITSVNIPNSVTTIRVGTFSGNHLTSVAIPNSVITIGESAFSNNYLTSVAIPNSVITIGESAFFNNQLTSVTIPNSVTAIRSWAFSKNKLTSITIGNSVKTIGVGAFYSNQLSFMLLPNPVINEGYIFTEWHNSTANIVTEITDFYSSYEAQFEAATSYAVSGTVTGVDDIIGLYLDITGDFTGTRQVNSDGNYSFVLNEGRDITITPMKEGYTFIPVSRDVNSISGDLLGYDFTDGVTSAIKQNKVLSVKIYPSPVRDILHIETVGEYNRLQVINLSGVVLKDIVCTSMQNVRLDLSILNPGVYIIKLTGEKGTALSKVIKK